MSKKIGIFQAMALEAIAKARARRFAAQQRDPPIGPTDPTEELMRNRRAAMEMVSEAAMAGNPVCQSYLALLGETAVRHSFVVGTMQDGAEENETDDIRPF